jgi:hypothetical protein
LQIEARKEGKKMKKAMLTMMLLAGGLFAAPHLAVGIGIGVPAPVAVVRPVCPGPGYVWMDGYYAPNGVWVAGYWAPPAVRVAPAMRFAPRPVFRGYEHFRR